MAHGIGEVVSADESTIKMTENNRHQQVNHQQALQQQSNSQSMRKNVGVMGSRRIFAAAFKLKVLDSYRNDIDCRGNQRATARKYGIHRRQIQKWLQCEDNLRSSCAESNSTTTVTSSGCCMVPVGSGVAASPALIIAAHGEMASKAEITTTASSFGSSSSVNSNSNSSNDNCNSVTSIRVSGSIGTPVVTQGSITAVPALNLSLARQHGDEQHRQQLAARQGPSGAPLRYSGRPGSSPTSLQYLRHKDNSHHRVSGSSSPNPVPLRNMLVSYTEYASQQEARQYQQNHQRHHRRQQSNEHPRHDEEQQHLRDKLTTDLLSSPERKYSYFMNCTNANYDHHDTLSSTGSSRSPKSEVCYQALESYHSSTGFIGLRSHENNNNSPREIGLGSDASSPYQDKTNNVNSAGNVCEPPSLLTQTTSFASSSSPLLLLDETTIKSERASPDSLATPVPCETPSSPETAASMPRARLQRQQHQQQSLPSRFTDADSNTYNTNPINVCITNTKTNHVNRESVATTAAAAIATAAAAAAAAVRSNETTSPLAHVHVSVDSHAPNARVSEKQQRDREHHQQPHRNSVKVEYEEKMGRRVKEEIVERQEVETTTNASRSTATPMTTTTTTTIMMMTMTKEPKREMSEEEPFIGRSRYHRERRTADVVASCPDYQEATAVPIGTSTGLSSEACSGLSSPIVRESIGTCSGLSSPRAASSSGISTSSSCSDSEIDPLDYSSNSMRNPISDLSRRRSFSLRFKLDVLDAFHGDAGVAGNQRATARKFGINRRQVQKWLGQESELRGEIALRGGDLRQRLGPMSETTNTETSTPVDLRTYTTTNYPVAGSRNEMELEHSSPPLYCCDVGSSSHRFSYYNQESLAESPEFQPRTCTLSCCIDSLSAASILCHRESAKQRKFSIGYPESQGSLYCYSPRDPLESGSGSEGIDVTMSSSPIKRSACMLTCCYDMLPSPKRICLESIEEPRSSPTCQDLPPQDAPLCLVKPKNYFGDSPMPTEPVSSTVPTPPAQPVVPAVAAPASKKNAILFKPYLDNPVSKPTDEIQLTRQPYHRGLSPLSAQSIIVNNNNNCYGICNLNEERSGVSNTQHDYALELSLRVPVTWRTHHGGYSEFPERLRSAFVRYPTSPHYT